MVDKSQETTHFGFQTVAKEQKADMVAHVFHSVASYGRPRFPFRGIEIRCHE